MLDGRDGMLASTGCDVPGVSKAMSNAETDACVQAPDAEIPSKIVPDTGKQQSLCTLLLSLNAILSDRLNQWTRAFSAVHCPPAPGLPFLLKH